MNDRTPANYPPLRRGMLLLAMESQLPGRLTKDALFRPMEPFYLGDVKAFEKDLWYLEAQDLAVREAVALPTADLLRYQARRRSSGRVSFDPPKEDVATRDLDMWQITPKGLCVVDGTEDDAGVVFEADKR